MSGRKHAGFTIFHADDGLDTGPVLLQRKTPIKMDDTLDDVYNRFLYPEGVKAMVCYSFIKNNKYYQLPSLFRRYI